MAKAETTYATVVEQELTEEIDTLDIDDLKANFYSLMQTSVTDDPNSEQMEVAA